MAEDVYDTRLDAYTLRQTRATKGTPAPVFEPAPRQVEVVELTEAQKARLLRQQTFRDAFARLETLAESIRTFSCEHHYFKPSTKQGWLWALEEGLEGMRVFLPKETVPPDSNGQGEKR